MANFTTDDYASFVELAVGIGEVGAVVYWDDTANSGQFRAFVLVDGGRSSVSFIKGGLMTAPAAFTTDFPNAVAISGSFGLA